MDNILITSGYEFENYVIEKYIDFCTGECVLGTGFLSSFSAGFADIFGLSSAGYENKLSQARECAIAELKREAVAMGANAIIGVDIDYTTFSSDIIGVVANGTAVWIRHKINNNILENIDEGRVIFPVVNYYANLNFRIYKFNYDSNEKMAWFDLCKYENSAIKAMNINVILHTIFETSYSYEDINITKINDNNQTEKFYIIIPINHLKAIKSVSVIVNRYVEENQCCVNCDEEEMIKYSEVTLVERRHAYGNDVVAEYEKLGNVWKCICGKENDNTIQVCSLCKRTYGMYNKIGYKMDGDELIQKLGKFKSCKDIYTYLTAEKIINGTKSAEELLEEISKIAKLERMYGNMKQDCIELIKKYYEE